MKKFPTFLLLLQLGWLRFTFSGMENYAVWSFAWATMCYDYFHY